MIDRDAETDWLRSHLTDDGEELIVLYGRRRVGKTTLVTSVFDALDSPTVYYLCDERGTTQNARQFAEQTAEQLDDIPPDVDGFVDAFEYLKRRLDEPAVVALDEFSYLVDEDETIPSIFQTVVDDTLNGTGISLVLLGSSISMMEEGVLSYESPLYGRRTGQWRMEPMTFGDAAGFFPDYTPIQLINAYSILGGVPAYLEQFDPDRSLFDNVDHFILSKGAFLYEEPEFLLRQELREPATYMAILEAIATGATRVSEIANAIDRDASSLSRYLQNLTRIGLVERETPVTDPDGRGVYRITDQFLRFWFRYVLPNRATLEQGHTEPVRDTIEATLSEHASWTFEAVCRQAVRTAAFPVSCSRVGRWWYGGDEIDVAAIDEQTDTLLLGECKWTSEEVGRGLLTDLEALESEVRWQGSDRSVVYALFAKTGFTETLQEIAGDRDDLLLFTPTDLLDLFEEPQSD
ncbi:ATP-binding protein [Halorubellus salinus]|uniref:ATP-binding protein n=1 Tax=Halorubellus salinus TaxID=755309 RepID=UPI001D06A552|nr:ATP-binding protein [Halorubellus salinus]